MYVSIYLSVCRSVSRSVGLSVGRSVCRSVGLSVYLSIYLSISSVYLTVYLGIYLPTYVPIYLSIYLFFFIYLSFGRFVCLSANLKAWLFYETSSIFQLTTSKTQHLCETSWFFELDHIKQKTINSARPPFLKLTFHERGCILEHQMCRFAKMISCDRCSTSYDLASLCRGRRSPLDRWTAKITKRNGTRLSPLHSTFHFWGKSRRIVSFLMWSSVNNEDVSRNCFIFDVVKFKNEGSLAELLRFWCGLALFLKMLLNPYVLLPFGKVHNPSRLSRESASERPKMARTYPVFNFFHLEMCFVPQWRALFRRLHFQSCPDTEVPCTFWLPNALLATTAYTFATSQLPKMVRRWGILLHFDFEIFFAPQRRAFFHHFSSFIWQCRSALLSTSPELQSSGTTQCFATFLFLRASAFFSSDSFGSILLS